MPYTSRTCAGKSRGNSPLNRSKSLASKAGEPELRIGHLAGEHQPRDELTHRWTMLETVSRAAPHQPHVPRRRMPVDDEVVVRGVLVLAHTPLEQGRPFQLREAKAQVVARRSQALIAGQALAARGVERGPVRVVRDLEPAPLIPGNPVHEARSVIGPNRERRATSGDVSSSNGTPGSGNGNSAAFSYSSSVPTSHSTPIPWYSCRCQRRSCSFHRASARTAIRV